MALGGGTETGRLGTWEGAQAHKKSPSRRQCKNNKQETASRVGESGGEERRTEDPRQRSKNRNRTKWKMEWNRIEAQLNEICSLRLCVFVFVSGHQTHK